MDKYYLIYFGEDGVTVEEMTKEKLEKQLNNNEYEGTSFLDNATNEPNSEYLSHVAIIIKGEIITPKPVEVVKTYEIE